MNNTNLSFGKLFNLSFGFFGVQIAYALQSANISRIFATLGADPHQLSFFWILPPLMGMIVQPIIGKYSDKTWCSLGRRKPYLLIGALIAILVMIMLPNAGNFTFTQSVFLGLNAAMWFGLFSLMFLDTSINIAMQPFKMMVGDMVNEEQKGLAYSIQSFLCNAGSLAGYIFPILFTWIGIANTAPEGVVPDSVKWSFYVGAALLIFCVLYTFFTVKELNPQEYAAFHGIKEEEKEEESSFVKLLINAPSAFWTVGLVQFFCWAAFLFMWTYSNGAIASQCFQWDGAQTSALAFQDAGNWVGVDFDFRSKKYGWQRYTMEFEDIKGCKKNIGKGDEFYFPAFTKGYIMRPSCFMCNFACPKRVGDITIGDFWGFERLNLSCDTTNGTSLCLINSKKAETMLPCLGEKLVLDEIDYQLAVKGNTCLRQPTSKGEKWDIYMQACKDDEISLLAEKYRKRNRKERLRWKIKLLIPITVFKFIKKLKTR